jgi:protease I
MGLLVSSVKRMLIFVENGVEDSEFIYPFYRFQEEGYKIDVVAPKGKEIYGGEHGVLFTSDISPDQVNLEEYDAVIIPGGRAPDNMRTNRNLVNIVSEANNKGKVIAAICHGPQMLIEAGIVRGKTATSWPSVRTDLENAGAKVVDQAVVVDGNLVTSRKPADLPEFCKATIDLLDKLQRAASKVAPMSP